MAGCLGGGLGTPPGPVSSCPDVGIDGTHCSAKMPDFVRDLDGMPTRRCANHLDGRRAVKTRHSASLYLRNMDGGCTMDWCGPRREQRTASAPAACSGPTDAR